MEGQFGGHDGWVKRGYITTSNRVEDWGINHMCHQRALVDWQLKNLSLEHHFLRNHNQRAKW
jgi:hypothetical protein